MTTRRTTLGALAAGLVSPLRALAQRGPKVARIGFLHSSPEARAAMHAELLRKGMREHGYRERSDFVIEFRSADGKFERLPALAAELAALKVDVIATGGTPATLAAMKAASNIPVVMTVVGDAVASGLVKSLARPGGNVTGTTYLDPELTAKRLELLRQAMPQAKRVAALVNPGNAQSMGTTLQALQAAAESMKVDLLRFEARTPAELETAFNAMVQKRVDAVEIIDDAFILANLPLIAKMAVGKRLPSTGAREFAEAGGMIGYGIDVDDAWRRAAYFVDKILKGANPADIPVERAAKFYFVLNMNTAKALGVSIASPVLLRADRVIE